MPKFEAQKVNTWRDQRSVQIDHDFHAKLSTPERRLPNLSRFLATFDPVGVLALQRIVGNQWSRRFIERGTLLPGAGCKVTRVRRANLVQRFGASQHEGIGA